MEKAKKRDHSIRAGMILALVWLLMASFVLSISAATSGNGNTTGGDFTWSWSTNNAAGDFQGNLSGTTLTLTIKATTSTFQEGSCGSSDTNAAATTTTAIVTNNTGSTIKIVSVTKDTAECTVSEGATLAQGDTFTVSIKKEPSKSDITTAETANGTITITYTVLENVEVTYYGADGASYTHGSETLDAASDSISEDITVGSSITLPAAPTVSSGTFAGWRMSHDGSLLGAGAAVTINNNTSIYPVITTDGAVKPFTVNETTYQFWTDAAKAAGSNGTIILNQDYTLPVTMTANGVSPAGSPYVTLTDGKVNLIVPSGVNFLIPYKDDDTGMFVEPTADNGYLNETKGTTEVYRTLTMANGANLTVDGIMNVNAQQYVSSNPNTNQVAAGYGCIKMDSGSTITIGNGGTLYCYGYIWGDGTVEAVSGAKVYERLEIQDWRGGSVTTEWKDNYDCFVISQYYVQNIEADYIVHAGAKSYSSIGIKAQFTTAVSNPIYIGASSDSGSALFILSSGKLIRSYDGKTDRMTYDVYGDFTFDNLSMSISSVASIDSKDYILPLNNAITLNMNSGTLTIRYPVKMLPGSQINITENATMAIESTGAVYIYDAADISGTTSDGTSKSYYYTGIQGAAYSPTRSANSGKRITPYASAQLVIDGTLTANGPVYTSEQAGTDVNKVLKGSGTFNNSYASYSESVEIDELWQDSWSTTYGALTVKCVPVVGLLAGISQDYTSFGSGTYYGLGPDKDNYWYQHLITVENGVTGVTTNEENPGPGESPYVTVTRDDETIENVVGYSVTGGKYSFDVADPKVFVCDTTATNGYSGSGQELNSIQGDQVLSLAVAGIMPNTPAYYTTLAKAVDNYSGTGYIQMLADTTESSITANKTIYLDLNGQNVTANLSIASGCTLYGMDTATNAMKTVLDTNNRPNYGVISTVTGTYAPVYECATGPNLYKTYVAVKDKDNGAVSFHRIRLGIPQLTFYGYSDPTATDNTARGALTFQAAILGDTQALSAMTNLGFIVNSVDEWYVDESGKAQTELSAYAPTVPEGTAVPSGKVLLGSISDISDFGKVFDVDVQVEFGEGNTANTTKYDAKNFAPHTPSYSFNEVMVAVYDELSDLTEPTDEQKETISDIEAFAKRIGYQLTTSQ